MNESVYMCWLSVLEDFKVKELVLVVDSYGSFESDRDVVFVNPAEAPWSTIRTRIESSTDSTGSLPDDLVGTGTREDYTWSSLREWMAKNMQEC